MEGDLLGLGEKVVRVAVKGQLPEALDRNQLFGNDFGGIKQVEVECILVLFLNDLDAQFPFGIVAILNGFPQIASVKVWVLTGDLLRFIPDVGDGVAAMTCDVGGTR
jgi:hypothetical protein